MSEEKSIKHVYRIPPCPSYDIEGMESWLSDMAAEGFVLVKDGIFAGVATFEKTEPRKIMYRLQAAEKGTSMWADNYGDPDDEAVDISAKYGWEYVAKRGDFHIYCSMAEDVRELNTDPEVWALALKAVEKRRREAIISFILWDILYPLIYFRGNMFILMINMKTWMFLYGFILFVWIFAGLFARVRHLSRLRKRILAGDMIGHKKDWRVKATGYYVSRLGLGVSLAIYIILLLNMFGADIMEKNEIPIKEYTADPPFVTLVDLVPEGEAYEYKIFMSGLADTVREWSDWLAPVNFDWEENAIITCESGRVIEGSLYVDYHETVSPWLANILAKEYHREDKRSKYYEFIDMPDIDAGYAAVYYGDVRELTLVIQKGNKIIHAEIMQFGEYKLTSDEWVSVISESLKKGK